MQSFEGIVLNGEIVLQPPRKLPEGAKVRVEVQSPRELPRPNPDPASLIKKLSEIVEQSCEHRRIHGGRTKEEIDAVLAEM